MNRIDPNNPPVPLPPGYVAPPGKTMIQIPGVRGGGFNPHYRLPDGSIVSQMELNKAYVNRAQQNAARYGAELQAQLQNRALDRMTMDMPRQPMAPAPLNTGGSFVTRIGHLVNQMPNVMRPTMGGMSSATKYFGNGTSGSNMDEETFKSLSSRLMGALGRGPSNTVKTPPRFDRYYR